MEENGDGHSDADADAEYEDEADNGGVLMHMNDSAGDGEDVRTMML